MAYPKKEQRNKDLVKKRKSDPKRWTWGNLAIHFKLSRPVAYKLYQKYKGLY